MLHAVLLVAQLGAQAETAVASRDCREEDLSAPARAMSLVLQGHEMPPELAPQFNTQNDPCGVWRFARSALAGWTSARALAAQGGAVELLGPVRKVVEEELDAFRKSDLRLEAEYAQTTIHAAIAAAQDERPEMTLLLAHARDLAERLAARGRRAVWPRPFNLVAGELWLEVDRYPEAAAAFERAVATDSSPVVLVGLARSYARLGNQAGACSAYRKVRNAVDTLQQEARTFLATCQ